MAPLALSSHSWAWRKLGSTTCPSRFKMPSSALPFPAPFQTNSGPWHSPANPPLACFISPARVFRRTTPKAKHGRRIAVCGGFFKPIAGLGVVLGYALALEVEQAKAKHGQRIALCGGFFKPAAGLGVVLGYALALEVEVAKAKHGKLIALCGSLFIPIPGFGIVLGHAMTLLI